MNSYMRPFYGIQALPFLLLIVLSNHVSGQRPWGYCKIKADSLVKSGIDTIICKAKASKNIS